MGLEKLIVSGLKKIGCGKYATCPLIGKFPTELQEKITKDLEIPKYVPMISQLALGTLWNLSKLYAGEEMKGISEFTGNTINLWAEVGIVCDLLRVSYSVVCKRPIGTLYLEIAYRFTKKNKKIDKLIEKYILN